MPGPRRVPAGGLRAQSLQRPTPKTHEATVDRAEVRVRNDDLAEPCHGAQQWVVVSCSIPVSSSCIRSARIARAPHVGHSQDGMCTVMAASRRGSDSKSPAAKPRGTYAHMRHRRAEATGAAFACLGFSFIVEHPGRGHSALLIRTLIP